MAGLEEYSPAKNQEDANAILTHCQLPLWQKGFRVEGAGFMVKRLSIRRVSVTSSANVEMMGAKEKTDDP